MTMQFGQERISEPAETTSRRRLRRTRHGVGVGVGDDRGGADFQLLQARA
jgi:hypothetical protein